MPDDPQHHRHDESLDDNCRPCNDCRATVATLRRIRFVPGRFPHDMGVLRLACRLTRVAAATFGRHKTECPSIT